MTNEKVTIPPTIELGDLTEQDLKNEQQIKEAVENANPEELLQTYLKDPQVVENLNQTAIHFLNVFRGNWFSVEQIKKKTVYKSSSIDEINVLVQTLILAHKCVGKVEKGVRKFKITITKQDKINHLEKEMVDLEMRLNILRMEKERVENELEKDI